jgi:hypothetical protein
MAAVARRPVVVEVRTLLRVLRSEAGRVWSDRRMAGLMAEVAARDLISTGIVRLVRGRSFGFVRK